ncbi:MAG: dienelactone hydrolase family protein [Chitinophagales bacterium]
MTTQLHITTSKTARIFTYGILSEKTKLVWIVTHGYGFLAEYFIKKFEILDPEEHFVVVPEALNRYYTTGMSGRVGASWMTNEDRENEIKDYITYLDNVYKTLDLQTAKKIVGLGFSQGASTIARWSMHSDFRIDSLAFWGSSIPNDCLKYKDKLNELSPYLLVGDEDEFITEQLKEEVLKSLDNAGITFSHIFYKGGHAILTEPLLQLSSCLTKP